MNKFTRKIIFIVEQNSDDESATVTGFLEDFKKLFKISKYSLEIITPTQVGAEEAFYFKEKITQP